MKESTNTLFLMSHHLYNGFSNDDPDVTIFKNQTIHYEIWYQKQSKKYRWNFYDNDSTIASQNPVFFETYNEALKQSVEHWMNNHE